MREREGRMPPHTDQSPGSPGLAAGGSWEAQPGVPPVTTAPQLVPAPGTHTGHLPHTGPQPATTAAPVQYFIPAHTWQPTAPITIAIPQQPPLCQPHPAGPHPPGGPHPSHPYYQAFTPPTYSALYQETAAQGSPVPLQSVQCYLPGSPSVGAPYSPSMAPYPGGSPSMAPYTGGSPSMTPYPGGSPVVVHYQTMGSPNRALPYQPGSPAGAPPSPESVAQQLLSPRSDRDRESLLQDTDPPPGIQTALPGEAPVQVIERNGTTYFLPAAPPASRVRYFSGESQSSAGSASPRLTTPMSPASSACPSPQRVSQLVTGDSVTTRMEVVWHGSFDGRFDEFYRLRKHAWELLPIVVSENRPPSGERGVRMFKDSAKVRFICENCGKGWTSMKGRVQFWYRLDISSNTGLVIFALFGQKCTDCMKEFQRPLWYPEEVKKVMENVYHRVGQDYYGFPRKILRVDRREGKPAQKHNPDLCQACHSGVCSEEWSTI